MSVPHVLLITVSVTAFVYFVLLNAINLVFTAIASLNLTRYFHNHSPAAAEDAFASPLTPGVSVIVPAFNEETVIVDSVRALLALRYPRHEVIVVNDGSTDATTARLHEEFDLVPVHRVLRGGIAHQPLRGAFLSRRVPGLCVIEKENGGRADALNVGVDAARYPYVCAIDADTILEQDALLQVMQPILDDSDIVVATGGSVRLANGCRMDHGRVVEERLPRSGFATFQVIEYFRAFVVGRVGWSSMNALPLISGAFGLFQRSLVEEVGGFSTGTVTEDLELVLRLHQHLRDRGQPYRIAYVAAPVCWTQAPEDLRSLSSQRRRWQRGLGESLWLHRRMIGNPRYGTLGLLALPFFLIYEFLGAGIELAGAAATVGAFAAGWLSLPFVLLFFTLSVILAIVLSLAAVLLAELGLRQFARGRDVGRLVLFTVLESFGYRQLVTFWRALAYLDLARRRKGWGVQARRGFLPFAALPERRS